MHFPHEQFDRHNVLWIPHGCSLSSRRRWRLQRLAMVSINHQHSSMHANSDRLFIVDGIISLPVCIATFIFLPDVPEICTSFYLTKDEIAFAQKRMQLEGRRNREPYTRSKIWKIFSSWHIYMLTLLYIFFNNGSANSQPVFQQFLKKSKDPKYSITQINAYPTTTNAVAVVTTLIYAWTSDGLFNGARWPPMIFGACMNILCYTSLAVWDIPVGWKWACYIMSGSGGGLSGLIFA